MAASYFPSTDAGLDQWARNLSERVSADPERFGVPADAAARLASCAADFAVALLAVSNPSTRSPSLVERKNASRTALKREAKLVVSILRGQANLSNDEKLELGLTLPPAGRKRTEAPTSAPTACVVSTWLRTVTLQFWDGQEGSARRRPRGVAGAAVFQFVGEQPPADGSGWEFVDYTIKQRFAVTLPQDVPAGATVWFRSYWLSTRLERGPWSTPTCANVPGGAAVVGFPPGLKAVTTRAA